MTREFYDKLVRFLGNVEVAAYMVNNNGIQDAIWDTIDYINEELKKEVTEEPASVDCFYSLTGSPEFFEIGATEDIKGTEASAPTTFDGFVGPYWYVYYERNGKIEPWNVFKHLNFYKEVKELAYKTRTYNAEFAKALNNIAQYYFWSKCEYEVTINTYPPVKYEDPVKVDVYDQLNLNFDAFAKYVFEFFKTENS